MKASIRSATVVLLAGLLSGCLAEFSAGPGLSLINEQKGLMVTGEARSGLGDGTDELGVHVRPKFSFNYNEVAFGGDAALVRTFGPTGLRLRTGASVAPLIFTQGTPGISPIGGFGEMSLLFCAGECRAMEGVQRYVVLSLGADYRVHLSGEDFDFGQDGFFYLSVGFGTHTPPPPPPVHHSPGHLGGGLQ